MDLTDEEIQDFFRELKALLGRYKAFINSMPSQLDGSNVVVDFKLKEPTPFTEIKRFTFRYGLSQNTDAAIGLIPLI